MGKTAHQIENHIAHTRDQLDSNIHELENKVKSATDWKTHVRTNPMPMIGVAFGCGVLIAAVLGKGQHHRSYTGSADHAGRSRAETNPPKNQALETWDNIKGALIGVAATRFKDFVGDVVPGFSEHFQRTATQAKEGLPATSTREPALH